ncbi:hypothetical protein LTR47_003810 [Exophiala xenobiotica]|nr:hypothetical protein LTR92_004437 [Exophiala xenobiotica]KAK5211881.1 hypothetical protein LTR41_002122 [Exophiala xenobiotica]KAK5234975.1 hypothetical protein LTR47_003810 [Exophiala xenobiotica]KAK5251977.1 hypothetical protein LTS06_003489 [Exophiala xenobiotica]KAK5281265.1 hypothetical protein LTR40_005134 [Exophiala xenobiotica]
MSSKRRSGPAGSPEDYPDTPDPKRRKRNDDTHFPDVETRETTTEIGLRLVGSLKRSQDKNGRNVAVHFLDLPDRDEYPDYYQATAMPLSLNIIEQNLKKYEYENLERLESDLKRMVQNAKDYNHYKSAIYEDAERIRKAISNFMPKHNPAYLRADYRAYPTPIPQDLLDHMSKGSTPSDAAMPPEKIKLTFSTKRRQSEAAQLAPGNEPEDHREEQLSFLKELSKQEDAVNFEEKVPKRDYPDYYKVIKRPTSISDVRSMVEDDAIPDWDSLAREVRLIWDNAKEYNQEGSEIYAMAEKLESWSEDKMQSLGATPKKNIRLSLSQPKLPKALRLKMGSSTPQPQTAGFTIDSESLRRQKEEMGEALSHARRASSRNAQVNGSTPVPSNAAISARRSASVATEQTDVKMTDVNGTSTSTPQPQPALPPALQPPTHQQLPTPVREMDTPAPTAPLTNGTHPQGSLTPQGSYQGSTKQSVIPFERQYRDPGKGLESALLGSVIFMTNPNDANNPKWKLVRRASATRTQTTGFITLPQTYRNIRIIPLTTLELKSRRRHRVLVMHNSQFYREPNSTVAGAYDVQLNPGENTLSVEVLADLRDGERKDYAPPQLQFDFEKCTLIINVSKQMA